VETPAEIRGTTAVPLPVPPPRAEQPAEDAAQTMAGERTSEPDPETAGRPGLLTAWVAFVSGIAASVAANMLHAAGGGASSAELIGAAFWPLALLLSTELLTRVPWPRGWWWGFGRFVGVGLVAGVAAILSYRHMAGLLTSWGEDPLNAHLGPLAVDGLMLVAATALLALSPRRKAA
jgi:hypothetical protein